MAFGKLYSYRGGPRAIGILATANAVGLDIEIVETHHLHGVPAEYFRINSLGKTPTFIGADGLVLTECMAIALHVVSQAPEATLLGTTQLDFVQIIKWISFSNTDVVSRMAAWVRPLVGYIAYSADGVNAAREGTAQAIRIFEDHLCNHEYLVADRLTLADLMCAGLVSFGFAKVFDKRWREDFPNFTRWFVMVANLPMYRAVVPSTLLIEEGPVNRPPRRSESVQRLSDLMQSESAASATYPSMDNRQSQEA